MLRANSRLRALLGKQGVEFLEHATGAIERILPHVEVTGWQEGSWATPESVWTTRKKTEIRMAIAIGDRGAQDARSLTAHLYRRRVPVVGGTAGKTLDTREHDICKRIALRISEVLRGQIAAASGASISAIRDAFDEHIIAQHVQQHHALNMPVEAVFDALHKLSEQTYENKSLTFGCVLDPARNGTPGEAIFPGALLVTKKYKALSDGYRTAYHVGSTGQVLNFVDLDRFESTPLSEKHFYPEWAEPLARASRRGLCGIALSRQGDILVFDEGTLRFTYRYGRWQYWNHSHFVKLLRDRARAQRVPRSVLGRVVGAIYRAALDVSFRRSGGLFVILHNRNTLPELVAFGDRIDGVGRSSPDRQFDEVVREHTIQTMPRSVVVELASLDGAIVLENSGRVLAYGAVLRPRRAGRLRGTEGSRTKAAVGASNYGLAVKISSDGDITVYHDGSEFMGV